MKKRLFDSIAGPGARVKRKRKGKGKKGPGSLRPLSYTPCDSVSHSVLGRKGGKKKEGGKPGVNPTPSPYVQPEEEKKGEKDRRRNHLPAPLLRERGKKKGGRNTDFILTSLLRSKRKLEREKPGFCVNIIILATKKKTGCSCSL